MIVQAGKFLASLLSELNDVQTPVLRRRSFGNQAFLSEGVEYPAQITFIDADLFPDLLGGAVFGVSYFIKYPPFREREWTVQKVLVKQSYDIGIKPVEAPYLFDQFLVTFHAYMIAKLLDFVK